MSSRGEFLLALQAEYGGSIPFWRFMHEALYHAEFGYYTTGIHDIGRRGDFTTFPAMGNTLGRAVAAWLKTRPRRHVIEVGAGQGHLAESVRRAMGFFRRRGVRYHIVEISPVLREQQRRRLGRGVTWHETLESALSAAGGEADIFSNELADAFPCQIFERMSEGWAELGLQIDGGRVREVLREAEVPESSALVAEMPLGARVEVHESFRKWMAGWRPFWRSGRLLTIDYGDTMPALYHRRPLGTIRAYAHHQRLTGSDVYAGFGRRDITADVNFSDLRVWGEKAGLRTLGLTTLAEFVAWHSGGEKMGAGFEAAAREFRVLEEESGKSGG